MKFGEQFNDNELKIIKELLTDKLDEFADPALPKLLAKDLAYLKQAFFNGDADVVIPIQTALRKVIEEIILRRVKQDDA